jgi:hypothetical protein
MKKYLKYPEFKIKKKNGAYLNQTIGTCLL